MPLRCTRTEWTCRFDTANGGAYGSRTRYYRSDAPTIQKQAREIDQFINKIRGLLHGQAEVTWDNGFPFIKTVEKHRPINLPTYKHSYRQWRYT